MFSRHRSVLIALAFLVTAEPVFAQTELDTSTQAVIFIGSGDPRLTYQTAYIPGKANDRHRLKKELEYLGLQVRSYKRLTNRNAREMLESADMITALPANVLDQQFATRFFQGDHFAFIATAEGLKSVAIRRADGQVLDAVKGPMPSAKEPPISRPSDGLLTILVTKSPIGDSISVLRYNMTLDQPFLERALASSKTSLERFDQVSAADLLPALDSPNTGVVFLTQRQNDTALDPLFRHNSQYYFYSINNYGIAPIRLVRSVTKEGSVAVAAGPAPNQEEDAPPASVSPDTPAVNADDGRVAQDPPQPKSRNETIEDIAERDAAAVFAAHASAPLFDLSSSHEVILAIEHPRILALQRAYYAEKGRRMRGANRPTTFAWQLLLSEQGKIIKHDGRSPMQILPHGLAGMYEAAAEFYARELNTLPDDWKTAYRRLVQKDSIRIEDGKLQYAGRYIFIRSSDLSKPHLSRILEDEDVVFSILDRQTLIPIRPVLSASGDGELFDSTQVEDVSRAVAHRIARGKRLKELRSVFAIAADTDEVIRTVEFATRTPSQLTFRGKRLPNSSAPYFFEASRDQQLARLGASNTAFLFRPSTGIQHPALDVLFTKHFRFVDSKGNNIDMPPVEDDYVGRTFETAVLAKEPTEGVFKVTLKGVGVRHRSYVAYACIDQADIPFEFQGELLQLIPRKLLPTIVVTDAVLAIVGKDCIEDLQKHTELAIEPY